MKMGRVSKRGISNAAVAMEKKSAAAGGKKRYKAGIYARLSADINERKSESIDVQEEIARKHIERLNQGGQEVIDVIECYRDLGKTGSNFDREGFRRLMQDIRLGDIDCVVVKDLSRFGRNYLEAGNYIEKIFPFLGVRFIAVSDGIDTGDKGNDTKQMASEIKNLVNDMYAKDFSKKAKTGLKQRRESGSYVGGPPPYGYKAVWEGKIRRLVPDENTAEIVKHIYQSFIELEGYKAVSDDLNRRRVNLPAVYKQTGEVFCLPDTEYKGWDKSAVERVIGSRTYAGTLAQGKTSITARDESSRIHKPEEEWVVKENAHEALVSTEQYQKAQDIRKKMQEVSASHKHPTEGVPIGENIFEHVLYCGVCGRKMTRHSHAKTYADGHKGRLEGYFCLNAAQTKTAGCPEPNHISKKELTDILMPLLRTEFAVYLDKPKRFMEAGKEQISSAIACSEKEGENLRRRIRQAEEKGTEAYVAYREGKMPQKEYVSFKLEQDVRLREMERQEKELEEKQKGMEKVRERYLKAVRSMMKLKDTGELATEMVDSLIEKIHVYPGKRIEAELRYMNEMLEGWFE
jgi:DNA invertase Pin-like site-specific DNA recombinase